MRTTNPLIILSLLLLILTGCGSFTDQLYRSRNIRDRFALLEPGMSRQQVHRIMGYRPDRYGRQVSGRNTLIETEVYKANYVGGPIADSDRPLMYVLTYEGGWLMALDVRDDPEQRHYNRLERRYRRYHD